MSASCDLDAWRALYDAVLTPATPGVVEVVLPDGSGPYLLSIEGRGGETPAGVLEAVRLTDDVLELHTSLGLFEVAAQSPRLRTPDGGLVDRATVLRAAETAGRAYETRRTLGLAGHAFGEGRVDEAIALLEPLVEAGEPGAVAALAVIEVLENQPGARERLASAAQQGSELARRALGHGDQDSLRMLLLGLVLE